MTVGRLTLALGAEIAGYETGGSAVVLTVEAGALALDVERGKVQVRSAGTASPGELVDEEAALNFGPSDALMLPPEAVASMATTGGDPVVLITSVVNPEAGAT